MNCYNVMIPLDRVTVYGVFTLSDTENENDTENKNDNYGFHYNMQSISHCTETDNMDSHLVLVSFSVSLSVNTPLQLV